MLVDVPNVKNAYSEAIKEQPALSRRHLNPLRINSLDKKHMRAILTHTNSVPQFEASNSGPWESFDRRIANYAKGTWGPKGGTLYLLTGRSENGLITVNRKPTQDLLNKVPETYSRYKFVKNNVKLGTPRSIWTAGCCVWKQKVASFAVMSNHQKDKKMLHQTEISVFDLQKLLKTPSHKVDLFPGNTKCAQNNVKVK